MKILKTQEFQNRVRAIAVDWYVNTIFYTLVINVYSTTIFNAKESVYFRAQPRSCLKESASVVYNFFAI